MLTMIEIKPKFAQQWQHSSAFSQSFDENSALYYDLPSPRCCLVKMNTLNI